VCVRVWFCVVAVSEDGMVTIIRDLRLYLYIYIYIRSDSVSDVETVSCSNNIVDIQFFWFSCLLFISFGLEFYSLKLS
jgi:hypothetical protein